MNIFTAGPSPQIVVTEYFDAPRSRVFARWTQSRFVSEWFAPAGFKVTACDFDAKPGARWHVTFESSLGILHSESGEFLEVLPADRLVFTLTQQDGQGRRGPQTLVTVMFFDDGGRTRMEFRQSGYRDVAMRHANQEGWAECFHKLAVQLA